jgi:hypothetical protein
MNEHCTCEPNEPSDRCPVHNPGYECLICDRGGMTYDRLMDHWFVDHTDEEIDGYERALRGEEER